MASGGPQGEQPAVAPVAAASAQAGADRALRRAERARRRAAVAERRAAWAGGRWWAPGAAVAGATAVVGWLVTAGWQAFEAAGCGNPSPKFECLLEAFVGAAAAVVAGPVLLWWAYRAAGVRRPLLSVLVALAVSFVLLAAPELLSQIRLLSGVDSPLQPLLGAGVAAVLGLGALGGGLALQGPRRVARAVVAAVALVALVASVGLLAAPAQRADTRLELAGAEVPLLLPAPGWGISSVYVGVDGDLSYYAVPQGWDGDGFDGVDVDVHGDERRFADTCSFRACTDHGDVRVEVLENGAPGGPTAWRLVDGAVVTVASYDDEPVVDPVALLAGMQPATVEEVVARELVDR